MENLLILSVALLVLGLIVTVLEIFIPSGGLLSIVAVFCFGGCLYCAYKVSGATLAIMAGVELACIPTVVVAGFKILPKTQLGKQLILNRNDQQKPSNTGATTDDAQAELNQRAHLQGRHGIAVTPLRPSGTAEFEGKRISVVTEGSHIHTGTEIRVILVEGNRVVVEAVPQNNEQTKA